jgi:peptidoglycan-associated lipoprotein
MRILTLFPLLALVGCKSCGHEPPKVEGPSEAAPVPAAPATSDAKATTPGYVSDMVRNFERIQFGSDATTLDAAAKQALGENAAIMQSHPDVKVEVQGHADERGTTEYNVALGQKRAEAVVAALNALGVAPSRARVVSYGEERPRDGASTEQAWAQNRRCEFVVTWQGDAPVQGSAQ